MQRAARYSFLAVAVALVTALALLSWQGAPAIAVEPAGEFSVGPGQVQGQECVDCHAQQNPALVMEWKESRHAQEGVTCLKCHKARSSEVDAWMHEGSSIATLVTPKDCASCHPDEFDQFDGSHHARAGEIIASLDNVLAEKVAGMPHNNADAVSGCWQCHGSVVKFQRDDTGEILHGDAGQPLLDPDTWPNSGMGRLNPDGSAGSCHSCHSRHSFDAKLSRSPENCGKCHLGPDHPQIEIYNESKHGIAFYTNRDRMALDKDGEWVLGRDYSAAPTCATCHISSYMTPEGVFTANTHDVGERISWTLRPVVSVKINSVIYEDGNREDYPETRALPGVGDLVQTTEKVVEDEMLITVPVTRTVAEVIPWQERRVKMQGACLNCHSASHTENFYVQFDDLVNLYNDKFAVPAQTIMSELTVDGVLDASAPFSHRVQWVFWELWHHEGRRARHGASMMGPDYTHWHGMYEVAKHFYEEFLPAVIEAAETQGPEMKEKYEDRISQLLTEEEHLWLSGLSPQEAEELRRTYEDRYNQ